MTELNGPTLPLYRSHKLVEAFQIRAIVQDRTGGAGLIPEGDLFERFTVDAAYLLKHAPRPGGYFVRYRDGYCSWSPAEAFEAGYTRVPAGEMPSWDPGPTPER